MSSRTVEVNPLVKEFLLAHWHTRLYATKLDTGFMTTATFAAPFRLPGYRNVDGKQNVRVAPI